MSISVEHSSGTSLGKDPFRRPANPSKVVIAAASLVSLWGFAYLTWRAFQTASGANLGLFIPLLAAEVVLWSRFTVTVLLARSTPAPIKLPDALPSLSTDVVITSLNDPIEWIRMSLVAANAVQGVSTVWIFDDGNRAGVAELAHRLNVRYVCRQSTEGARAGNMNAALELLRSDNLLFLNGGDIAMPDAVAIGGQLFQDNKVSVVQLGSHHWNRAAVDRTGPGRNDRAYVNEVIRPANDARRASAWLDGPSIVRRADMMHIGGFSGDSPLPELTAGVQLQQLGRIIRFYPETLVETPGPRNVQAAVILEERRAQGVLASIALGPNPLASTKISLAQRLVYLGEYLHVLGSVAVSASIVVLAITITTAQAPLSASLLQLGLIWGPWSAGAALSRVLLAKGRLELGGTFRRDLRYLGAHLRALGSSLTADPKYRFLDRETAGPRGMAVAAQVSTLAGLLLAVMIAVSLQLADVVFDIGVMPTLSGTTAAVAYGAAAVLSYQSAIVLGMLARSSDDTVLRSSPDLMATIAGRTTRVTALNPFAVTIEAGANASAGLEFPLTLTLMGLDGVLHGLDLHGKVASTRPTIDPRKRHAVVHFEHITTEQRDNLIEFCYVVHAVSELRGRVPKLLRPSWLAAVPA
jgi:hypothetical protein